MLNGSQLVDKLEKKGRPWRLLNFGILIAWIPAVLVVVPLLLVLWRAWAPGGEAWNHVCQQLLGSYVWQTLLLVSLVVALTFLLGVPTAWWMATCEFRGRGVLHWALVMPLAVPGFVAALAYSDVFQIMVPVYVAIRQSFGVEMFLLAQDVMRWVLAVLVLGGTLYPYVYLTALASFSQQSVTSLEAARMLGVGSWRVFWSVALPMARPALAAGGSLVAFETLNDYGVSNYFGITTLTVGVFRAWLSEGYLHVAIRLAMVLLLIALGSVFFERWQRGRRGFDSGSGEVILSKRPLPAWTSILVLVGCFIPLMVGFALPGWRLARWAYSSIDPHYDWSVTLRAALHSFSLAGMASLLIAFGALLLVASRRAFKGGGLQWAQKIGVLGYALPSALVAVGVGALFSMIGSYPGLGVFALSASTMGLLFAYFTRFLAVTVQPLDAGFRRVSGSLHEVSRTLGVGPWKTLLLIDLPLVWRSLLAGTILAFVDIYKELTLTLVLRPFDYETLATQIVRLTDESRIPEAAVPALMLVGLSLFGLIPLMQLSTRRSS